MIQELQDDIRLKAGKNNALVEEQVVVKEQLRDSSNQLINVKWQLAESRKALDVCVTSAINERALGEKKMAEMAAEMATEKELEEELQRHKELLEEGNKQLENVQVENEQLRRNRPLMKFVVRPNKTPPTLIPKHP
ncbi:hypothetical protein VZT92_026391 [Zoarces viviparus]|uniref:Uncharacterized protein n=1 Tax=Zoarces viviparus TaxID=48416 RepID=A0AAW1E030_ZOAVI